MSSVSNFVISSPMKDFMDAVTNPFGATRPAQVPDGYNHHTICLSDWVDNLSVTVDCPDSAVISGIAFYLMVGQNDLTGQLVFGAEHPLYTIVVMPITSAGLIQSNNSVTGLTHYYSANYSQITGSTTGSNSENSLVDSLRIFGAALRIWPTIEMITSSDTLAVSQYYAGLLTPNTILKCYDTASNFYNVIRQSEYIEEFTNSQGCCCRLDPFGLENFLTMRSLENWQEIQNFDTSLANFPLIVVRFTQNVGNGDTIPIKLMSQYWIEGQLVQPTPIFTQQAPYDHEFSQICKILANSPETYPIVEKGHSFKSFLKTASKLSGLVSKVANASSHVLPADLARVAKKVSNITGKVSTISGDVAQKLPAKKKKKKKAKKKTIVIE